MENQKYTFKEPDSESTFDQRAKLGTVIAEKSLGKTREVISNLEIKNLIDVSNKELGNEVSEFELKSPDKVASYKQFELFGKLRAQLLKITTKQQVSNEIQALDNAKPKSDWN